MSNGSHMVGGRTYRNVIITTNEVEIKKAGEPEKLTVLTTEKIPGPKAQPATKGWDPSRMITTHDQESPSKVIADAVREMHAERDVEDMSKDKPDEAKKKPGRPKKAE